MSKRVPAKKARPRPAKRQVDTTMRSIGHRYDGKYKREPREPGRDS